MTFEGAYGAPIEVHYYANIVHIEDPSGDFMISPYGEELTAMTDSAGSLVTLPTGGYLIRGYTNQFGCFNPEPANQAVPTTSPAYRLISVPHLLPE